MDKFDYIILSSLAEDCRQSFSGIGKKIKRSPQFVTYRVEQLKQHSIKQIPFIVDFNTQGYQEVVALIKFPLIDPLREKMFIDSLFKRKETYKLFSVSSEESILCSFVVKKYAEIEHIKKSLGEIAPFSITFFSNYKTNIYAHNYLGEHHSEKKLILEETEQRAVMSPLLKNIIAQLQQNPFISNLEISQNIDESYDKVTYATKNNAFIIGNNLLLSPHITEKVFVFLKVNDMTKLNSYCDLQKNIVEINQIIGSYDAILHIETTSNSKQILRQILFELKDNIQEYKILEANNTYKYGWYQ